MFPGDYKGVQALQVLDLFLPLPPSCCSLAKYAVLLFLIGFLISVIIFLIKLIVQTNL